MSFDAMAWAFHQSPNKSPQKHLLLILAYRSNDNNQCYPSISCLIRDTGMGRRTIQEHLRELLAQGFINITERIGASNLYTLIINASEKSQEADNPAPLSQHPSKKTADLPCETRIQNKSLKSSPSQASDLTPAMKAAYDWAKKEPFWSPKITKIVNFIRFYSLGDLKNQYLHFLNKNQSRFTNQSRPHKPSTPPSKKIKTKELWEKQGFKSEKDYHDDLARKTMKNLEAHAFNSDKPSFLEIKINKLRLKQTLKRNKKAEVPNILSPVF